MRLLGRVGATLLALVAVTGGVSNAEEGREEGSVPRVSIDGFGTVGFTYSNQDEADFAVEATRPKGPGATEEWSYDVDTRFGAQLSVRLSERLSAVLQLVSEQESDGGYGPNVEWAILKFSPTERFSLRLGRTALPIFASSDYRKVSYANVWLRPPVELYSLVPIFTSDGLDGSFRHRFGGWTHTVQLTLGRADARLPGGSAVEIRDLTGVFNTFDRGALTLHTAFARGRVTIEGASLDVFRSFGKEGERIADRFGIEHKPAWFAGVGASYDPGRWFLLAELGRVRSSSLIGRQFAGYTTLGRRVGRVAFYCTYSRSFSDTDTAGVGLTLEALPPESVAGASALNQQLGEELAELAVQRTIGVGLRWDYRRHAAFKLGVDRVDVGSGSYGTFVNRGSEFGTGESAWLVSLGTDFVF